MPARPLHIVALILLQSPALGDDYQARVAQLTRTPGFAAFWDFVLRDSEGRFRAHQPKGSRHDLHLDAINYVRDYWNRGRPATHNDIPLLNRGPFGRAIRIRPESDPDFRPCLIVPRERLHGSRIDVGGPGKSASMVAWVVRTSGNHAIAGIWHEGTDLAGGGAARVESGRRQYALFAGLAANNGASAVHVSENGNKSFGDKYARNLAVTPEHIPTVAEDAHEELIDRAWSVVGFTFDNKRDTVTAYLNGIATEYWIDNPHRHPFFQWPARGWLQGELRGLPGMQEGEDPAFPTDQFYRPPEMKPVKREIIRSTPEERIELQHFAFTRVKVLFRKGADGRFRPDGPRELVALKANPFWFGHDIYRPATPADGGPFTIGRVIHTSRGVGFTGYIGGVAVFDRALSASEMRRIAAIGRNQVLQAATNR